MPSDQSYESHVKMNHLVDGAVERRRRLQDNQ